VSIGVRVPREVVARIDAAAPRLALNGMPTPKRSQIINAAIVAFLVSVEKKR